MVVSMLTLTVMSQPWLKGGQEPRRVVQVCGEQRDTYPVVIDGANMHCGPHLGHTTRGSILVLGAVARKAAPGCQDGGDAED